MQNKLAFILYEPILNVRQNKRKYIKYTSENELETINSHGLNGYTLDC